MRSNSRAFSGEPSERSERPERKRRRRVRCNTMLGAEGSVGCSRLPSGFIPGPRERLSPSGRVCDQHRSQFSDAKLTLSVRRVLPPLLLRRSEGLERTDSHLGTSLQARVPCQPCPGRPTVERNPGRTPWRDAPRQFHCPSVRRGRIDLAWERRISPGKRQRHAGIAPRAGTAPSDERIDLQPNGR
jgi:rubredoxin